MKRSILGHQVYPSLFMILPEMLKIGFFSACAAGCWISFEHIKRPIFISSASFWAQYRVSRSIRFWDMAWTVKNSMTHQQVKRFYLSPTSDIKAYSFPKYRINYKESAILPDRKLKITKLHQQVKRFILAQHRVSRPIRYRLKCEQSAMWSW